MPDETLSAEPELDTAPAPQQADPHHQMEDHQPYDDANEDADQGDSEDPDGDGSLDLDEFDEFEWEGKQFKAPKTLKERLERLDNMDADYTRKSQANAARAKELEERSITLTQQAEVSEKELEARANLQMINQQLQQYQAVNWDHLDATDPMAAQTHWRNFQMLKEQRGELSSGLETMQQQRLHEAQQATAKRLEATREFAQKEIKGWTPEVDVKLAQFATSELGFSTPELNAALNPAIYRTLYLAYVGQQSLQKQQAQPRPAGKPVQPLQTVNGKSAAGGRKSFADMSMEEYAAARKAGRG